MNSRWSYKEALVFLWCILQDKRIANAEIAIRIKSVSNRELTSDTISVYKSPGKLYALWERVLAEVIPTYSGNLKPVGGFQAWLHQLNIQFQSPPIITVSDLSAEAVELYRETVKNKASYFLRNNDPVYLFHSSHSQSQILKQINNGKIWATLESFLNSWGVDNFNLPSIDNNLTATNNFIALFNALPKTYNISYLAQVNDFLEHLKKDFKMSFIGASKLAFFLRPDIFVPVDWTWTAPNYFAFSDFRLPSQKKSQHYSYNELNKTPEFLSEVIKYSQKFWALIPPSSQKQLVDELGYFSPARVLDAALFGRKYHLFLFTHTFPNLKELKDGWWMN